MDVPTTVTTALEDRPVAGATCLEAGAGVGNTTAGLLAAGAARVYAVTNDSEHARIVHERVDHDRSESGRTAVLESDLRRLPLETDSIGLITAHGLCNVLEPASLATVARELTRVATPGCHLVVDDYDPLPEDAAVRELFALENAAVELVRGRPALTFYPADALRRLFAGYGWEFDRERTLLDPVPWTASHLEAHAEVVQSAVEELQSDVGDALARRADDLVESIGAESVGRMYSIAFRYPA